MPTTFHHLTGRIQLTVTLLGVKPVIWRSLVVSPALTLEELHMALQVAMGWTNSHLHQFRTDDGQRIVTSSDLAEEGGSHGAGPEPVDEKRVLVASVLPSQGSELLYEYDFGDGWTHRILHEGLPTAAAGASVPAGALAWCVDGAMAGPLEDCGGPPGHERIVELLGPRASKKPPRSPELRELLEWIPRGYDPRAFDRDSVNADLARVLRFGRPAKGSAGRKRPAPRRVWRQRGD